jgi:hypothetical protein
MASEQNSNYILGLWLWHPINGNGLEDFPDLNSKKTTIKYHNDHIGIDIDKARIWRI